MQRVDIICFGKLKESFWRDAVAEYRKRLSQYCKLTINEIDEVLVSQNPSEKEVVQVLEVEAQMAKKYIRDKSFVIALCVEGKQMTSEELADKVSDIAVNGYGDITFLIGSSYGLSEELKRKADFRLSFSEFTFPHQLMRVILTEQIYRAYTINHGAKYHK